jgi:aspartyl-tRNA(Asn)/glutamyl-tRNA(Gln) amidotransferase subunit A
MPADALRPGDVRPHQRSFRELRNAFADGALSPVDVTVSALEHAAQVDATLNAFALIDPDRALAAAAASTERWHKGAPLSLIDGMPASIKEFAAVQGWPTRRGSAVTPSTPAAVSADFVERIERAGGVLLGKTRAPEFNWKGVTDSPAFGITRNPWDERLTPGGSSGGCAAAVAAGVVRVSMGSDAGGSVRIPAAFTGTLALKPTFGRIPATPLPTAFHNLVHTGPIAASASDLDDMMSVVAGASPRDWTSQGLAVLADPRPVTELRVGILAPERWRHSVAPVKDALRVVADLFSDNGFELKEVDFDVAAASRVGALLYRLGCLSALNNIPEHEHWRLDQEFIRFARQADGASMRHLVEAIEQRDRFANALGSLFSSVDVLMLPTMPILAFDAGCNVPAGWHDPDWMSWNPYTPAFNLTQTPALSYPVWIDGISMPTGVQFVAGRCREDRLVALARWLEPRLPIRLASGR